MSRAKHDTYAKNLAALDVQSRQYQQEPYPDSQVQHRQPTNAKFQDELPNLEL